VWKSWNPECTHGNHELLIALKEEDSTPLFLSPRSNAPHALIAGSTGSGKSVLMQNIILGIACTNTPEQARIVLIDPKAYQIISGSVPSLRIFRYLSYA
jgi:DNA segregation ATPase FtsK/SpoIIIE, S-DNA-T family